jgi:4-amino-4-deoxy-L-arabinose transferase-like glycosyltransferase
VTKLSHPASRELPSIALLSLVWLSMFAWPRPLMLPDEGRYVGVAWEMIRSGDWLVPTLNGLPYFHKPPLFYWITAASMSIFGPNDWAARAAPLLGAWAGAMAIFLFVRRWWGEYVASLVLIVLLVQPLFYIGSQFANLDMLVAGCITTTIVLLAHAALVFERGAGIRLVLSGAYITAALGILAKGLIGAVLPALVIGIWLAIGRRWRALGALLWLPGTVMLIAVAAPWFISMQWRFADFMDYFFVVQHFKRFAAGGFNNVQPFWFYPAVLLVFTSPWLPWLRPLFACGRFSDAARGDLRLLMVLWLAVIVLFFSFPASKLLGYVLPAVTPLAVLLADGIESGKLGRVRPDRWWKTSAVFTAVLSLAAITMLAVRAPHSAKELGLALRTQRSAGEPVYMLGSYYFDVPIYGRFQEPAGVVLEWTDPNIRRRDSWRKELADAGVFSPQQAQVVLLEPAQLSASICAKPVSWAIGPADSENTYPFLAAAKVIAQTKEATLWRVSREHLGVTNMLNCS